MTTEKFQYRLMPRPLVWATVVAIILFCATGVAAMLGWLPASWGTPGSLMDPARAPEVSTQPGKRPATRPAAAPVAGKAAPAPEAAAKTHAKCATCGVVESIREIDVKGEGSGLGAAGGAVVGGLIGSQVGDGRGKQAATVIGAVGGVIAGNEVEKRLRSTTRIEVVVRLDDGTQRVVRDGSLGSWRTGDHVRIVDGAMQSN
ncbi:MAG: glycine zipper 2TM domain-containing protein [Burkholderiales bacterium]